MEVHAAADRKPILGAWARWARGRSSRCGPSSGKIASSSTRRLLARLSMPSCTEALPTSRSKSPLSTPSGDSSPENDIPISGQFSFKDLQAIFIRDRDRNVIELDAYAGDELETRGGDDEHTGYQAHP